MTTDRLHQLRRRLLIVLEAAERLQSNPPVVCIGQGDYGPLWLVKIAQAERLTTDLIDRIQDRRRYAGRRVAA